MGADFMLHPTESLSLVACESQPFVLENIHFL
jgi:hypothetical protein